MALNFAQLLQPVTYNQAFQLLLSALQGLGVVINASSTGGVSVGTGACTIAGAPVVPAGLSSPISCILKISLGGELGVAQVQISIDGGLTYTSAATIPANGVVAVIGPQGTTNVTATFASGPTGAGTSFVVGDTYSFSLTSPNFPVNAWQAGSVPRTIIGADAQALADWTTSISAIAAGGFAGINPSTGLPYASGPWMDLCAQNVYGLTRSAALPTQGQVTFTDTASQGPFTFTAGQLIFASSTGQQYQTTTGGVCGLHGSLNLQVQAVSPGSAGNAANNSITVLSTPIPGATVNNPPVFSGGTTWISSAGTDAETDSSLSQRCTARWSTLGTGATAATYLSWALTADATINRALVQTDPTVAGQVDLFLASTAGPASGGAVTNVQNYVNARVPLTVQAVAAAATGVAITINAVVFYFTSKTTAVAAQAAVVAALQTFFNNYPLGTDNVPSTYVYLNDIIGVIEGAMGVVGAPGAGIRNCTVSLPAADVPLTRGQVATLTIGTITYTGV